MTNPKTPVLVLTLLTVCAVWILLQNPVRIVLDNWSNPAPISGTGAGLMLSWSIIGLAAVAASTIAGILALVHYHRTNHRQS